MKVIYDYRVAYRKRYPKTGKMPLVRMTDRNGQDYLKPVNGRPYYGDRFHYAYCKTLDAAQLTAAKMKTRETVGYVKIQVGPYEIEESWL